MDSIGKALLKYAYRSGKADALDYLLQYDLIASRDELHAEIRRLRKELAKVTEEREILKKAAAFFAKESQ